MEESEAHLRAAECPEVKEAYQKCLYWHNLWKEQHRRVKVIEDGVRMNAISEADEEINELLTSWRRSLKWYKRQAREKKKTADALLQETVERLRGGEHDSGD